MVRLKYLLTHLSVMMYTALLVAQVLEMRKGVWPGTEVLEGGTERTFFSTHAMCEKMLSQCILTRMSW